MFRRHAVGLAAAGPILFGKALVKLGLKTPPEAWRALLGVALRGEPSKFGLSAFGLTVRAAELPARLHEFLRTEPEAAFALTHTPTRCTRHPCDTIDLVVQRFDAGELVGLDILLDPHRPVNLDDRARMVAHVALIHAYRATSHLPEATRPAELARTATRGLTPPSAAYLARLLKAACLTVEPLDGPTRFVPPPFAARRGFGHNAFTFAARTAGDAADLWGTAHHVAADGVPFQELFTRLERAWGTAPTTFPAAGTIYPVVKLTAPGEPGVYQTLSFHDFAPLLRWRKRANAELGLDVPFGAMLLWALAKQPEFAATKFASTVDVAATPARERCVDLVSRRPAEFAGDLGAYARSFLAGVAESRDRRSSVQRTAADLSHLPPRLYRAFLEAHIEQVVATFGEVGLSVIRDAKVFTAPLSDVGYPGGFFAVGGVALPAAGGTVGAVTVKGPREQAETYPSVLARALKAIPG